MAETTDSRDLDLSDLAHHVVPMAPQITPSGDQVVVMVRRADLAENRYVNELVLVELESRSTRVLTHERPSVRHPRWSPSGDRLAFLAADSERKDQVFVMNMAGGDPVRITEAKRGVHSFAWRPDGECISFVAEKDLDEPEGDAKHNKAFEVGDNAYLAQSESRPRYIWTVVAEGGESRCHELSEGSVSSSGQISWHPSGDSIAFQWSKTPHSGTETMDMQLHSLDLGTGEHRLLTHGWGYRFGWGCAYSVEGDLLFLQSTDEFAFSPATVNVLRANGETLRLGAEIDRSLAAAWCPDGQSVLAAAFDGTGVSAWRLWMSGEVQDIELGSVEMQHGSLSRDGALAFIAATPDEPMELYVMASLDTEPERVTDFNHVVASRRVGKASRVAWRCDGFGEEDGVTIFPPDFDATQKYPLVLVIHGGPMGTSTLGFDDVFTRALASRGWIVFCPNYRGSTVTISGPSSTMPVKVRDAYVMAGIDHLKAQGFVDESRIAVSGWSYGGYMTVWLTAHYTGWRTAVAGAAVTDWYDWYNLADMNVWAGLGLGGSPWLNDNMENYWRQSPIAYASNIRTPTLILSNTGDARVTVTQSYKLYHALKDNDVRVQFIAYPIAGHVPGDPVHAQDVYQRWLDWIEADFESAGEAR
ncbi:MAG: prolyl oligopeptidase family serine peptidase [Gammaproteobacteria bacterium]|nr:prolyl oligopeptidase family serine peptidase [Gammaproteobacteria bacterium]